MLHQVFHRRLSYCCLAAAILFVAVVILQRPSKSSESASAFSNMPAPNDVAVEVSASQDVTVIFDVPDGQDYQINSLQTPLTNTTSTIQTVTATIQVDEGGVPGEVVVNLGSQAAPSGPSTAVFIPIGSRTLTAGHRYWLILSNPGSAVDVWSAEAPTSPTGVFTFVENGLINEGVFSPQTTYRYNLTLDVEPIPTSSNSE